MVFFSSCKSVKYHYELLNYIDLPVLAIHVSGYDKLITSSLPLASYVGCGDYGIVLASKHSSE